MLTLILIVLLFLACFVFAKCRIDRGYIAEEKVDKLRKEGKL